MSTQQQVPTCPGQASAVVSGAVAMVLVGGSTAVSAQLTGAPLPTVQALRYTIAAGLLLAVARATGRQVHRPRGREWFWLAGVTGTGLLLFNVALVHGSRHAEPAVFGVAVASVPLVLALLGPRLGGGAASGRVWTGAALVTAGAVLVVGFGRADLVGAGWAVVVLVCEAAFTLLAVPVLARHGAWGVSVHTSWLAAVGFGVAALLADGPTAIVSLGSADVLATGYLAVGVTALAFVCWYGAVVRLGAHRAGLLTGVAPVAAAVLGTALGGPLPGPAVWVGIAVVAVGLTTGLLPAGPRTGPGSGSG